MENSEDLITLPEEAVIRKIYWVRGSSEHQPLRSQIATLKRWKHSKYRPSAFTESGVETKWVHPLITKIVKTLS